MAERRMFAKTIVLSDAFLDMSPTARCLYFTLGMFADDDGFVNSPKGIMRQCGASEDDLKLLLAKKFVLAFESGVIVIKHWRINNYLRSDRYVETKYTEEKSLLTIDEKGTYGFGIPSMGIPSIGKDSIDKDSIGKDSNNTPTRKMYGQYKNVPLSDEQYSKLKEEFPSNYEEWIEKVSDYVETSGKHYKNYLAVIRNWAKRDAKKVDKRSTPKKNSFNSHEQREYNYSELDKLFDI